MTGNAYTQTGSEMTTPTTQTLRRIARIAGVLYIIIIVAGMFAGGFARPSLLVPGDATATAANLIESEGLLRASILADFAMIIADVAIGVTFYYLLKPVNPGLSLLSALFRLAQAATLGINLLMLFFVLQLLSGADYLTALGTEQIHAQALLFFNAHSIGYKLALMFFAFSILIQGYLLYVAGYFPKILGVLVIVASMAYFVDNLATFIMPNYDAYAETFQMIVMIALPVELILALWLLVKGVSSKTAEQRVSRGAPHAEALAG